MEKCKWLNHDLLNHTAKWRSSTDSVNTTGFFFCSHSYSKTLTSVEINTDQKRISFFRLRGFQSCLIVALFYFGGLFVCLFVCLFVSLDILTLFSGSLIAKVVLSVDISHTSGRCHYLLISLFVE